MNSQKTLVAVVLVALAGSTVAHATNLTVGLKPSDGVAMFVKQFSVAAGTAILGAEFVNNDSRTVFPGVMLVRGVSSAMNEGTVVAQVTDASEVSGGVVNVTWEPSVTAATAGTYFVGVRIPEGAGSRAQETDPR